MHHGIRMHVKKLLWDASKNYLCIFSDDKKYVKIYKIGTVFGQQTIDGIFYLKLNFLHYTSETRGKNPDIFKLIFCI